MGRIVAYDNGFDYNAVVSKNIVLKLLKFLCCKRRYFSIKLRVNSKFLKISFIFICKHEKSLKTEAIFQEVASFSLFFVVIC